MRAKITKRAVDAMRPGDSLTDTEVGGFRARRRAGAIIYELRYRKAGQRKFLRLGTHGDITPDDARTLAKKRVGEIADNRDPAAERQLERAAATNTVNVLLDAFLERYVGKQGLRSAKTIESAFDRLVRPHIGAKSIYEVTRRDVVELLDAAEDTSGPVMADRTLAYLRKALNWWATRDEKFAPPIVKGMSRTKPNERRRTRILDDSEIRDLWHALDTMPLGEGAPECYPRYVRALLLTGQRRSDLSKIHSDEIESGSTNWIIPKERFRKAKVDHLVPLTPAVCELINLKSKGFLFSSDSGKSSLSGFSKSKRLLDKRITEIRKADGRKAMPHWVLHDLRRTARSALSRLTTPDIAERVIGHVVPGIRGTYDQYSYADEKREALERLAAHVHAVVHPGEAVVPFPRRKRRAKM
jgi:integrase